MLHKLFKIALVVSIIIAAIGWNLNKRAKTAQMSELVLANVEALAGSEGDSGTGTCYHTITSQKGSKILYCGTCRYIDESTNSWNSGKGECK